jgi:hypothetical protein
MIMDRDMFEPPRKFDVSGFMFRGNGGSASSFDVARPPALHVGAAAAVAADFEQHARGGLLDDPHVRAGGLGGGRCSRVDATGAAQANRTLFQNTRHSEVPGFGFQVSSSTATTATAYRKEHQERKKEKNAKQETSFSEETTEAVC